MRTESLDRHILEVVVGDMAPALTSRTQGEEMTRGPAYDDCTEEP
jgi:hypothetical protein